MSKPYRAGKTPAGRREVYEVDEIRRVLKACPDTPSGHRDRFAVMLLWCTGMRPSELVSLRPGDYVHDLIRGERSCDVVRAGHREIVIPGGQQHRLRELLEVWQSHRLPIAKARSPLLCNLRGGSLDTSYLRHMLAELAESTGIDKRLHAQGFRNTFAAAMHYRGVPMEIIRRQLGLSDLEYTAGFVALVAPVGQDEAMATFSLESTEDG